MSKSTTILLALVAVLGFVGLAQADTMIDFESYTPGLLDPQGGWISTWSPADPAQVVAAPAAFGGAGGSQSAQNGVDLKSPVLSSGWGPITTVSFLAQKIAHDHFEVMVGTGGTYIPAVRLFDIGGSTGGQVPHPDGIWANEGGGVYTSVPGAPGGGAFQVDVTIDFATQQYQHAWTDLGTSTTYTSGLVNFVSPFTVAEAATARFGVDNHIADSLIFDNLSVSSIPEPSTVVLLLTAGVGLLAYAWRKRR